MYEGDRHECPFNISDTLVKKIARQTSTIVVDFHAEITAEKKALGLWLDGKISCFYGTHTHIQTADAQILPRGTAYLTDIGMTGSQASVIGMRKEDAFKRFLGDGKDRRWKPAGGQAVLHGLCVAVDDDTGKALSISRIQAGDVPTTVAGTGVTF